MPGYQSNVVCGGGIVGTHWTVHGENASETAGWKMKSKAPRVAQRGKLLERRLLEGEKNYKDVALQSETK